MRRLTGLATALVALLAFVCFSSAAQQPTQTHGSSQQSTPPSSQESQEQTPKYSKWWPLVPDPLPPLEPPPPETVVVPRGTRLSVVLDTPLSTRMTKPGESVTFLLSQPLDLGDGLALPPDTRITGAVTEAKRPGAFGRAGKLKVKIEKIELGAGGEATLRARLQSGDPQAVRLEADNNRAADLYALASWTLQGTLVGASIKGGKGAAVGAGAGAAAALIIMMARKGPDLYLEPGMPFEVTLDAPVELRGWDVRNAQRQHEQAHAADAEQSEEMSSDSDGDPQMNGDRPKLKHRPKKTP